MIGQISRPLGKFKSPPTPNTALIWGDGGVGLDIDRHITSAKQKVRF